MRYLAAALALLALSACSSTRSPDPVGIGEGVNELKRSPCACTEIPMGRPSQGAALDVPSADAGV